MLFHVTHTHNELTCPIHDDETLLGSFGQVLSSLKANGVDVLSAMVDGPGHQLFFVFSVYVCIVALMYIFYSILGMDYHSPLTCRYGFKKPF